MSKHKNSSLAYFLKIVLDILLLIGLILFTLISYNTLFLDSTNKLSVSLIFVYVLFLIGSLSLIYIVYNLRKMIKSVVTKDPFVKENVKSLRNIWKGSFTISICYFINFFINPNFKAFQILYIDAKGIHTDLEFFIFFFASLFILVLEKVFEVAVKYKEENDLTI